MRQQFFFFTVRAILRQIQMKPCYYVRLTITLKGLIIRMPVAQSQNLSDFAWIFNPRPYKRKASTTTVLPH